MKRLLFTIFFITIAIVVSNATTKVDYSKRTVKADRWEVIDVVFHVKDAQQPFDIPFDAVFTNAKGEELVVPGFYNGGDEFLIRFSSSTLGLWTYKTNSDHKELNGKAGKVLISHTAYKDSKGAITLDSENPQQLKYENGDPYFLMAFELDWLFALDYGTDTHKDAITILDEVQKNRFNQIVMNLFAYDINWERDSSIKEEHYYGSPDFHPFLGDNTNPDFSTLNIDFFKHFDEVIELMNERDIIAHLMIYVWNKQVNWPAMYSEDDNRYFDYVIKRYQAFPNMLWDISKEALLYGRCDEAYLQERISRVRDLDAYKRLLTVHDYGFCANNANIVDFISTQNWNTELYSTMLDVRDKFPNKPIFNIEHGGYERSPYVIFPGNYDTPESCLSRNYTCAFAGVYSTYYWQASSWSIVIPDIYTLKEEDRPRFDYMKHFYTFFEEQDFHSLIPQPEGTSSGWAMNNRNGKMIFFAPDENCSIHLRVPKTEKELKLTWYNPLTGEYQKPYKKGWQWSLWENTPIQGQDWLLVVEEIN